MCEKKLRCSSITSPKSCKLDTLCTIIPFIRVVGVPLSLHVFENVKAFDILVDNCSCNDSRTWQKISREEAASNSKSRRRRPERIKLKVSAKA